MSRFRVAFDGEWQENFDTLGEAVEWAQEVSATGRTTWVVERRLIGDRLRATFPEQNHEDAEKAWRVAAVTGSFIPSG